MLIKNALVYLHLLAMAVAVGRMLEYDFRFLRSVHRPPTPESLAELLRTKTSMAFALCFLWLSGLALVYLGYTQTPQYLENEKLWMKFVTVAVLTVNGMLMHRFAFPHLQRGTAFLALPLRTVLVLSLFAAVSSASWLFASFLGIARWWNNTVSFEFVLSIYVALIALAGMGAMVVMYALRLQYFKISRPVAFSVMEFNNGNKH